MVFSWEQEGYNPSASTDGKWIVYKREGDNNVKVGEVAANEHSLNIEKKQYSCSNGYIMTFLPMYVRKRLFAVLPLRLHQRFIRQMPMVYAKYVEKVSSFIIHPTAILWI